MRYSLSIRQSTLDEVRTHLFTNGENEKAAYLYCNVGAGEEQTRLLVSEWEPVQEHHIEEASPNHLVIIGKSYRSAMKRADRLRRRLVFVHSHPDSHPKHSPQDDKEEAALFRTAYVRIHNDGPHASLVLTRSGGITGRVWREDGSSEDFCVIRIIGDHFRFVLSEDGGSLPDYFDRQVRAFGADIQRVLAKLHIGIVGVGGTGSSVAEQLIRLGVGNLTVSDGDAFDPSNVSRVYGSSSKDAGKPKAQIAMDNAGRIDIGTLVQAYDRPIMYQDILRRFADCDVIFCCVDKELPRALLNRLSLYYLIPVFDMGVEIDSSDGVIKSVTGRVTALFPGSACLFCRGTITEDVIQSEALEFGNATEAVRLRALGYAKELGQPDPAVVMFTTAVAAQSAIELLHRLTAFAGTNRKTTETKLYFSDTRLRTTARKIPTDCLCSDETLWGRGDREPFLDSTWPT